MGGSRLGIDTNYLELLLQTYEAKGTTQGQVDSAGQTVTEQEQKTEQTEENEQEQGGE